MKTLKRPHTLLVALLCLWLPLQAAAGLWLPCHWLDRASEVSAQQQATDIHQGCGVTEQTEDSRPSGSDSTDTCYHCQVSCHFGSAVLLPDSLPALTALPTRYTHFPTPPWYSVLLDNPHRPPRFA